MAIKDYEEFIAANEAARENGIPCEIKEVWLGYEYFCNNNERYELSDGITGEIKTLITAVEMHEKYIVNPEMLKEYIECNRAYRIWMLKQNMVHRPAITYEMFKGLIDTKDPKMREFLWEKVKSREFNSQQMYVISWGLDNGVDVSVFANGKIPYKKMHAICQAMIYNGVDLSPYKEEFLKDNFSVQQIKEISLGLSAKLDVSVYAKSVYSANKMSIIRQALLKGFDVSRIANPRYSYEKMKEIYGQMVKESGKS